MRKPQTLFIATVLAASMSAQAQSRDSSPDPEPHLKRDNSWISISGTVVSPGPESFTLDYGDGTINVRVGDWDVYRHSYALMGGGPVTVYGRIDEALFERDTIDAASVYVESLDTYLYDSAAEENAERYSPWPANSPVTQERATIRGVVTNTNPADGKFTVDSGKKQVTIDTDSLGYNPLDEQGYQKVESGDTVSVSGKLGPEFLAARVLGAERIVSLWDPDDDSSRVAMPTVAE